MTITKMMMGWYLYVDSVEDTVEGDLTEKDHMVLDHMTDTVDNLLTTDNYYLCEMFYKLCASDACMHYLCRGVRGLRNVKKSNNVRTASLFSWNNIALQKRGYS